MKQEIQTVYELVGGEPAFEKLVNTFYAKVESDGTLRNIFPPDLEPGKRWQKLFLMQYFGGPSEYSENRGHPRLRMRHHPFAIDHRAGQLWLKYMLESIEETQIPEPARTIMRDYFERAAAHMINTFNPDDE